VQAAEATAANPTEAATEHWNPAEIAAVSLYAAARDRFVNVDGDLLKLCGRLTDFGVPIQSLLDALA
jgi:hypothetical protein